MRLNNRKIVLVILLFCTLIVAGLFGMASSKPITAVNGTADLRRFNFSERNSVCLDGQWEFYWNQLLTPQEFAQGASQQATYIHVPGSWITTKNGSYSHQGYATYRCTVILPNEMETPAIKLCYVVNAYRLYANGKLIAQMGNVSDNLTDYQAGFQKTTVVLPTDQKQVELVLQVANLDALRGGIRESVYIGDYDTIMRSNAFLTMLQFFGIGCVVMIGIYYVINFSLNRRNKTALFFGLLCILIAIRACIWGEIPMLVIFPVISMNTGIFINYMVGYNIIPICLLFFKSMYPDEFRKISVVMVLLLAFNLLLFTPVTFASQFNNLLYLMSLLAMMHILAKLFKAVIYCRKHAKIMLFSVGILLLTTISDILHYTEIVNIYFSNSTLFGNVIVILVMSYIQAAQQAQMQKSLECANERLREADRLKDTIRTTELAFLQAQIKPHFLYNALSAIAYISGKDGKQAESLIIDMALYLRESFAFNTPNKLTTLEKELDFVNNYFHIEKARFGDKIELITDISVPITVLVPALIIEPLVENAVRHGISKKTEKGTVTIRITKDEEFVLIEITDDGVGMTQEKADSLLSDSASQHVGIRNIQNRLCLLYGSGLEITSTPDVGTVVRFKIPQEMTIA